MQTAVYALYQRHELGKASCFLTRVAPYLGPDVTLYFLINDEDCWDIRAVAADLSPHIRVLHAGRNLGVAGGRNYLIRTAIENGADFLVSCDTDIILEPDYFRRMVTAYRALHAADSRTGMIQPLLLNGPDVLTCFSALTGLNNWNDLRKRIGSDTSLDQPFWPRVCEVLGEAGALSSIMHSGMSNIWAAHYGPPVSETTDAPDRGSDFLNTFLTRFQTLRDDRKILGAVIAKGDPVRIGTTAGGISAFHRRVFEQSGAYDEIFNPFGFEDSEFGFRSLANGFHHYLVPDCVAIHDIFVSGQSRSLLSSSRIGLLRGVETGARGLTQGQRSFCLRQSLLFGVHQVVTKFANHLKQAPEAATETVRLLPSALASYGFEFFRGLLHTASRDRTEEFTSLTDLLRPGRQTIGPVTLPLDENVALCFRQVIKVGELPLQPNSRFSIHAYDCHIAETAPDGVLRSRFFDISMHVRFNGEKNEYCLTADILSDDVLYQIILDFCLDFRNAAKDGVLRIIGFECRSKAYDYGAFSEEDLYPAPRLHASRCWLPMVLTQLRRLEDLEPPLGLRGPIAQLTRYLLLGKPAAPISETQFSRKPIAVAESATRVRKRIMIFGDSRAQHIPAGCTHQVFAERLAADPRLDVELFLCPMKWTTTLDFLEQFPPSRLAQYDHVILYTGIVEWAPRPAPSAYADVYDNRSLTNHDALGLNTYDYSKKIVNSKKALFDQVFGAEAMAAHLARPFDTQYEGHKTINMYSLDMARDRLIPLLAVIPNLIFITANRIVPGWEGDFKRGRPKNMAIVEGYSDLFATELSRAGVSLVNLLDWSLDEVKVYTCDNLHLTERGNNFIYESLMKLMKMEPQSKPRSVDFKIPEYRFVGFGPIERVVGDKRATILKAAKCKGQTLASLIIGVRHNPDKPEHLVNLRILLAWIDHYYGDLFDVLLFEQDSEPRLSLGDLGAKPYVRHKFIYNPDSYNRGWGYNVAVRHYCQSAKVVALMDTDVLTGPNFVRDIIDCYDCLDVASPYLNIYYTDAAEAQQVRKTMNISDLKDQAKIKNAVTVTGGIVIWNRAAFMAIKGFEQYVGYSCEDRAMDVTVFNHIDESRIRVSPQTYVHLHHDSDGAARSRLEELFGHLAMEYGCIYDKTLSPYEIIHKNCQHVGRDKTLSLMLARSRDFGDPELYRRGDALAINGVRLAASPVSREVLFKNNNKVFVPAKEIGVRQEMAALVPSSAPVPLPKSAVSSPASARPKPAFVARLSIDLGQPIEGTNWSDPVRVKGMSARLVASGQRATLALSLNRDHALLILLILPPRSSREQYDSVRLEIDGAVVPHTLHLDIDPPCLVASVPVRPAAQQQMTELALLAPSLSEPTSLPDGTLTGCAVAKVSVIPASPTNSARALSIGKPWYQRAAGRLSTKPLAFPFSHFDGLAYVAAHSDVAEAILGGRLSSGLRHYQRYGRSEGRACVVALKRNPSIGGLGEIFDGKAYLEAYPDIAEAVRSGMRASALEHYVQYGRKEGRRARLLLDGKARRGTAVELAEWETLRTAQASTDAIKVGISKDVAKQVGHVSSELTRLTSVLQAKLEQVTKEQSAQQGRQAAQAAADLARTTEELRGDLALVTEEQAAHQTAQAARVADGQRGKPARKAKKQGRKHAAQLVRTADKMRGKRARKAKKQSLKQAAQGAGKSQGKPVRVTKKQNVKQVARAAAGVARTANRIITVRRRKRRK